MFFSATWLKNYLPSLPKAEVLLEKLTMHSVEVEGIVPGGLELGNVVVAEVLSVAKHPNADKLNVGTFEVGEAAPRQIIFGGLAELKVGDKIPVALAPTVLPGNFKIQERKLRGELSQGMCCLNSELGILDRQEVVHHFGADVLPGTPIVGVLPLGDTMIDIDNKSMTHRSDLFSHIGMAREIAAVFAKPFREPTLPPLPKVAKKVPVSIASTTDCPRYLAIELEVTVGDSPAELAHPLLACGQRSINNVVDITNFVMLEYGQPLHAFDAEKISGGIKVRRAKSGERLMTLDGVERTLGSDQLVIADSEHAIAVAGVMGGQSSGISAATTRIILEVANFEPLLVRRSASGLGIRTESVLRFEKGLAPALVEPAARRAIQLLTQHAGARVIAIRDVAARQPATPKIPLKTAALERLTGQQFSAAQIRQPLVRLGCQVKAVGSGPAAGYSVTVPWWRRDLHLPEDLIEEVVRLHGVNSLPEQQLTGKLTVAAQDPELVVAETCRDRLVEFGLSEVMNYSFYGEGLMRQCGLDPEQEHLEIANPLSDDLRYLRTTLLPGLFTSVAKNQTRRDRFGLFEVGHLYFSDREVRQLALVLFGGDETTRRLRGIVESLAASMQIPLQAAGINQSAECPYWQLYAGHSALLFASGGQTVGTLGQLDASIAAAIGISGPVSFCTLSLPVLTSLASDEFTVQIPSPFPAIPIDLSFLVPADLAWAEVETLVKESAGRLFQSLELFDLYQGDGIPAGKKSLAFHLTLESPDRTLAMTEVENWRDQFVKKMHQKFGAELRDK